MGQGVSGSSKPIIAGMELQLGTIADSGRSSIRTIRDSIYGSEVQSRIASLHIEKALTAARRPWQNPYAERLIGSIRRECLDHFVILNARHRKRTLNSYFA